MFFEVKFLRVPSYLVNRFRNLPFGRPEISGRDDLNFQEFWSISFIPPKGQALRSAMLTRKICNIAPNMIFSKKHLGKSHVGFHEYQFVSGKFIRRCAPNRRREAKRDLANIKKFATRWWFQIFCVFTPTWGRFLFWLIHHQLNTYGDLWSTCTHTTNLKRYMEDLDCLAKRSIKRIWYVYACMNYKYLSICIKTFLFTVRCHIRILYQIHHHDTDECSWTRWIGVWTWGTGCQ